MWALRYNIWFLEQYVQLTSFHKWLVSWFYEQLVSLKECTMPRPCLVQLVCIYTSYNCQDLLVQLFGSVGGTVASHQEGVQFEPWLNQEPLCGVCMFSPSFCEFLLGALISPQSKTCRIGDLETKLSVGECVSCDGPAIWAFEMLVLAPVVTLHRTNSLENGWMDGSPTLQKMATHSVRH